MPLPANVTTVTVLGTFLTPEGDPSTGTITFTPSSWLTNSGANVAIPNSPTTKTLGTAGNFSVLLPITDDADLSPSGWVYNVSEVVDGVSQNYNILLPGTVAVGGTVYLADLVPAAPAGPEYYSLASSLTIGTVTTVATGGSATASITGLAPSQVLDLGIPTGATGTVASAGSGSVGTAAVAPTGDPNTGIYFPAVDQVGITTGGSAAAIFAAGAISNPTFTGVAQFPDGSASAPSITNTGDTNTGIAFPADDTVIVSTGGTQRMQISASGNVTVGATTGGTAFPLTVTTDTSVSLADGTSGARSDGTIRLSLPSGGTNAQDALGAGVTFSRVNGTRRGAMIAAVQTSSDADQTGLMFAVRTGAATSNDLLVEALRITHLGYVYVGNGQTSAAPTTGYVAATGGSGTDIAGGTLNLYGGPGTGSGAGGAVSISTAPAGASGTTAGTLAERLRVDSNGLITGTGTSLGAWTAYTPTLAGTGWAIGNGTITGAYCQIGKVVVMRVEITFGSTSTFDATNAPTISLPVTAGTGMAQVGTFVTHAFDLSAAAWYLIHARGASATTVTLQSLGAAGLLANVTSTSPFTWATSDVIRLSGVYQAA